jgi:cytochrome P450
VTQQQEAAESVFGYYQTLPYDWYKRLRSECPVYFDPMLRGNILTRYADVAEAMSNTEEYRLQSRPEEQYADHQSMARVATFRKMLSAKTLSPYVPTVIKPEIDRLLDQIAPAGKVELFSQFSDPLPSHIISMLFGLEPSDFGDMITYRDARIATFNSPPDDTSSQKLAEEWQEKIDARMREVIALHRKEPRDNLVTWLLEAEEDGAPIPDDQIIQIAVRDLLLAGSETSAHGICNAMYNLLTRPELLAAIQADRALLGKFVEEVLRFDPPVPLFWRATNADVEISGCPVAKGTQLYPGLAAANRDPAKFDDPEEFRIDRPGGQHLSFSLGDHRCPGAWLGRTEIELAVGALLDRLPNLRLDPDAPPPLSTGVVTRSWRPQHLLFDAS